MGFFFLQNAIYIHTQFSNTTFEEISKKKLFTFEEKKNLPKIAELVEPRLGY